MVPKAIVVRVRGKMHIRAARCARVCMDGATRCAACATQIPNWSTYNSKLKQAGKAPDEVLPRPANHRSHDWLFPYIPRSSPCPHPFPLTHILVVTYSDSPTPLPLVQVATTQRFDSMTMPEVHTQHHKSAQSHALGMGGGACHPFSS